MINHSRRHPAARNGPARNGGALNGGIAGEEAQR